MAGGLDVHKNKFIEEWGARRENLEKTFRFNRKTLTIALIAGVALPYLIYQGTVDEFVSFFLHFEFSGCMMHLDSMAVGILG